MPDRQADVLVQVEAGHDIPADVRFGRPGPAAAAGTMSCCQVWTARSGHAGVGHVVPMLLGFTLARAC